MQITSIKKKTPGLLNKAIAILFGIFITSFIFALFLKALETIGLYLALILCIGLIFCGFYYIKKGTMLRLITWGMTGTVIIGVIFYIIGMRILSNILEGF